MKQSFFRSRIEKDSEQGGMGCTGSLKPMCKSRAFSDRPQTIRRQAAGRGAAGTLSRRAAFARPRVLAASILLLSGASIWWATAQGGKTTPQSTSKSAVASAASSGKSKPITLDDLEHLVREGAARKRGKSKSKSDGGIGKMLFALTERDLTAGSPSDEREPEYSSNGEFIAFSSTGSDTNGDGAIDAVNAQGRYHIWIMNRDGSQQRQITGLTTSGPNKDDDKDQRQPSFSADGNQLVFGARGLLRTVDPNGAVTLDTTVAGQIFITRPFEDSNFNQAGIQPPVEQRTFFRSGEVGRPNFGGNGLRVVFAHSGRLVDATDANNDGILDDDLNGDGISDSDTGSDFDIFTISPTDASTSLKRLTVGNGDDVNPAFSLRSTSIILFASDRLNSDNNNNRRIWLINSDGSGLRQVTNPSSRVNNSVVNQSNTIVGTAADVDDYPAASLNPGGRGERVAFQSNSKIDSSDTVRDNNIWSLNLNTQSFQPTPTPTPFPTPKLVVSSFNNSRVLSYNAETGGFLQTFDTTNPLVNPEGVEFGPDLNNDGFPELYVSNRGLNRVDVYDGDSGSFIQIFADDDGAGSLTNPTGLVFRGQFLYVASGVGLGGTATASTNKVHRFSATTGVPAPGPGQAGSVFTSGNDGVTNGIEGIVFGPDFNNDGVRDLYATAFSNNKVTVFDGETGVFLADAVTAGQGGLQGPTGLDFGPNGDLFVSSSGTDDVLRYTIVPGSPAITQAPFVQDADGSVFGLNAPEGLRFGPDGNLYVSSLDNPTTTANAFDGDRVLRFNGNTGAPLPSAGSTKPAYASQNATFTQGGTLSGPSGLAFFPRIPRPTPTPVPSPSTTGVPPVEGSTGQSRVETNTTSSTSSFNNSKLTTTAFNPATGAAEPFGVDGAGTVVGDVADDIEPGYSRSTGTAQTTAQLAFASNRRAASTPGNSTAADGSPDPRPRVVNPQGALNGGGGTHDIWATATEDFTPPILVPISSGNARFPLLAPGPQSPINAPRTPEQGLLPGNQVRVGVVMDERESGLQSVSMTVYNADEDRGRFTPITSLVNEKVPARTSLEGKPNPVSSNIPLAFYDDGPVRSGGRERQAGAVAGDGIYYCEVLYTTPANAGDFYFDLSVSDKSFNSFTYDNIWGFSTKQFSKSGSTTDLFVSDYTQGQQFPAATFVFPNGDPHFLNMRPVESYYLTNPGNVAGNPVAGGAEVRGTTFTGVDIWRILCRGEVPQNVLDAYAPTATQQINPNDPTRQFTQRTRSVAVASSSIIWASPYTGTVFSGPGTLFDSETQRRLTNFLRAGGRLFVSGRDVAFSLSGNGQASNTFLADELNAGFGGEVSSPNNTITADTGRFTPFPIDARNEGIIFDGANPFGNAAFNDLQMPPRSLAIPEPERTENTFLDAAINQNSFFADGGTIFTDSFTAGNGSATVIPAYTIAGKTVGQRVERGGRNNGFQSRVVFFGFGLEGINRRVTRNDKNFLFSLNIRNRIANNLKAYFKTGGISGRVINDETNLPVPNFLLQVEGGGQKYFVRTDANGNYEILGLPTGGYVVSPAVDSSGQSLNPGFKRSFAGTPLGVGVTGPNTTRNINFRVIPAPLGSISGVAVQSNGTFNDRSDDTPLPNIRVLVRSVGTSSIFPGGGKFARLTTTDAGGRFNISGIPTDTALEVIFNPKGTLESAGGDIPDGSGIATFTQDPAFGRRIIPDSDRPGAIILPNENPFILNDGPNDTAADSGVPILIPVGRTITGRVFLNNIPLPNSFAGTVTITPDVITATNKSETKPIVDGNYSFFDRPNGTYTITANATRGLKTFTASVRVTVAGDDVVAPTIFLLKQDVFGRVTVNGGDPGAALVVELLDANGNPVIGSNNSPITTTTANDGTYVFLNVAPGTYRVAATRNGVRRVSATTFTVTAFDPATGTGGDAIAPTIEFFDRFIRGVVTLNGQPSEGRIVQLLDANQQPILDGNGKAVTTTTAADGSFSFPAQDRGIFFVQTGIDGINGTDVPVPNPTRIDASTSVNSQVTLALFLYTLQGRASLNGQLSAGILIELFQNGTLIGSTQTVADGTYQFDRIVASPNGTVFTVRARRIANGQVVDSAMVDVTIVRGGPIIVRAPDLGLVTQNVGGLVTLNGVPIRNAKVELLSPDRKTVLRSTITGTDGRYQFVEVLVGDYVVRATALGDVAAISITVERGRNIVDANIALFLRKITGKVFQVAQPATSPRPAAGASVQLINSAGRVLQTGITARDGSYTFKNVVGGTPSATYTIRASRFGDSAQIKVQISRLRDLQAPTIFLVLERVGGRVTLNDVPIGGVTVLLFKGTVRIQTAVSSSPRGEYVFFNVAAGDYTVRAVSGQESAQVKITVQRGRNVTVPDLKLIRPDIRGQVLVNNRGIAGIVVELVSAGTVIRRQTTDNSGFYGFQNVSVGSYIVRASRGASTAQAAVRVIPAQRVIAPTLRLQRQFVTGTVTLDGRPRLGVVVQLISGPDVLRTVKTTATGSFALGEVDPGRYIIRVSAQVGSEVVSRDVGIVVNAGVDLVVPVIALRSPTPTPTPTPEPEPDEFQPNQTYQISVPYSDSTSAASTTTVAKAFTVVPNAAGGVKNYQLFRFDPLTLSYQELDNNSVIRRGEGYFLRPLARGVSIKRPANDSTRKPFLGATFEIVLRRNPSGFGNNNGFNLIGFPFDPARYGFADWLTAEVFVPDGRHYDTVMEAEAAGVLESKLRTFDPTTGQSTLLPTVLEPFKGYYARTNVNGVRVILKASVDAPSPTP